jgi:hypothetical protein
MRTYAASLLAAVLFISAPALARSRSTSHRAKTVSVKQYTKKSGQTVQSHKRSAPQK